MASDLALLWTGAGIGLATSVVLQVLSNRHARQLQADAERHERRMVEVQFDHDAIRRVESAGAAAMDTIRAGRFQEDDRKRIAQSMDAIRESYPALVRHEAVHGAIQAFLDSTKAFLEGVKELQRDQVEPAEGKARLRALDERLRASFKAMVAANRELLSKAD